MAVKPATQILARRTVRPIAKDESLTLSNDLFADLVPGTGSVAVSVGMSTALDAAALLAALDRYPFGCSEQITSRALAAALRQRSRERSQSRARHVGRAAHPRALSTGCWRGKARTGRSGCGRPAATMPGSTPTSPTSSRAPRNAALRCPTRRSSSRSSGYAISSAMPRSRARPAAAISPMRSMCWRGTARRRSATCAISPIPSSMISRPRSPRRRSPPRSACSATARAPSASMRRRCARWRRSRRWNMAAPTTARSCATRRPS